MSEPPRDGDEVRFVDTLNAHAYKIAGTRGVATWVWVSGFNRMVRVQRVQRIGGPFIDGKGVIDVSEAEVERVA